MRLPSQLVVEFPRARPGAGTVDRAASKAAVRKGVWVRVPPRVLPHHPASGEPLRREPDRVSYQNRGQPDLPHELEQRLEERRRRDDQAGGEIVGRFQLS